MSFEIARDCRHYIGDRPCKYKCLCRCEHYDPMGKRIVIIKLGALGDVVRTVSLLPSLKAAWPQSHITWISKPNGVRILRNHPQIDRLFVFDAEGVSALENQSFDLVISLDKEPGPTGLCNAIQCEDKRGIRMSAWGTPEPTDERCEPYFRLGLDDDLKFHHNRKTYPELIHEALGIEYVREPYLLYPGPEDRRKAEEIFSPLGSSESPIVGLNTGAGRVFAHKAPRPSHWVEIAKILMQRGCRIALLGGPDEAETNRLLAEQLGPEVLQTGSDNTELEFTAIVGQCDVVVAGDTLAMHCAISQKVPVVALFGPTCEQEIDLFERGRKIVTTHPCSPCYRRSCDENPSCMDVLDSEEICSSVWDLLEATDSEWWQG